MRFKTVAIIILTTFLALGLGLLWQTEERARVSADIIQFGKSKTIQPNSVDTEEVTFSLTDEKEQVRSGEEVVYKIYFLAKENLKGVRIVGTVGESQQRVSPTFSWDLGNMQAGQNFLFKIPVTIQNKGSNLVISRVTVSAMEQPRWWSKERREVLAIIDDVDQLLVQ